MCVIEIIGNICVERTKQMSLCLPQATVHEDFPGSSKLSEAAWALRGMLKR